MRCSRPSVAPGSHTQTQVVEGNELPKRRNVEDHTQTQANTIKVRACYEQVSPLRSRGHHTETCSYASGGRHVAKCACGPSPGPESAAKGRLSPLLTVYSGRSIAPSSLGAPLSSLAADSRPGLRQLQQSWCVEAAAAGRGRRWPHRGRCTTHSFGVVQVRVCVCSCSTDNLNASAERNGKGRCDGDAASRRAGVLGSDPQQCQRVTDYRT